MDGYEKLKQSVLGDERALAEYEAEKAIHIAVSQILNSLNDLRASKGMTKKDLADLCKLQPSTVRRILSGKTKNLNLTTTLRLLAALGANLKIQEINEAAISPRQGRSETDAKPLMRKTTEND